jgi:hypothetical protein
MSKVYAPGLTTAEIAGKQPVDKWVHLPAPETSMNAGHPKLRLRGITLEKLFGPVVPSDLVVQPVPRLVASIAAYPKSAMTAADWNAIRDGKWTIAQLKSLIYSNDLQPPEKSRKEDLITYVMDHRKDIA